MKRFCVLVSVVFFALGCASDADKSQWDAFWKDLRGENMQMKGSLSGMQEWQDHATSSDRGTARD
jgi:hypothetical protein